MENNQRPRKAGPGNPKHRPRPVQKEKPKRELHAPSDEVAISLENVSKTFRLRENAQRTIRGKVMNLFSGGNVREIKALQSLNLKIYKGEIFGIIGRNGSGKSTLIHLMTGAYLPDPGGKVSMSGKFMRMSLGMGFNKELTARENTYINCSLLGLSIAEIDGLLNEIIAFSELEDFVDTKIKYYSKGMVARLSFAIAIHAKADIFLMDEFFGGVGDEGFKKKADEEFKKTFLTGRTIVNVSHSPEIIKKYCHRVLLLNKGEVLGIGTPEEIIPKYLSLFKNDKPAASE